MTAPLVTSMACATLSCPEPDEAIRMMTDTWDWEVFCTGAIDQGTAALWGIAPGSAGDRFTIVRSRGMDRGMIRVVHGGERIRTSPMSTRWSGIEIVVMDDLVGLCKALETDPAFDVVKPVDEADFTHAGANVHAFFHGRMPGLTHAMFTMAVTQPESYAFPESPNRVGQIFDVHLDVDNTGPSRAFYGETLGMEMVFDDMLTEGLFYDTWDLDPETPPVRMSIFKGDAPGFGLGGIEMRSFDRATMDPTPPVADRFDAGTCMTAFTCRDIAAVYDAVSKSPHAAAISEPMAVDAAPYNGGLVFCATGPEGERLEFSERWQA
jgi:catechol 2,3-dioxygenase-like lactoylglutathione lyase family enzyme